jgi:N-acetylglucosamine kinase-like BadF-type ATPase
MKVQGVEGLVPAVYSGNWNRTALAGLAPLLLEAAAAGDKAASELVENGARALAEIAVAVARNLDLGTEAVPLALCGGLFIGSADYRAKFLSFLVERSLRAAPVTLIPEPARGALRLANLHPFRCDAAQSRNKR